MMSSRSSKDNYLTVTEQDFYPYPDDRNLKSYILDIHGGDNFADYCEEFFNLLEEEEYYN